MLSNIIKFGAKLSSITLIFIYPIIYLIIKFGGVETVETTQNSMPLIILLILSAFILVVVIWLGSQLIVSYWEYVKTHPFGFVSTFIFGLIVALISFLAISWLGKLNDLIVYNTDLFLQDLALYKSSITHIMISVIIGLLLSLTGFVYEKATQ